MGRRLATLAVVLPLAYAALCALAFVAQRQLIYLPDDTRVPRDGTDCALARDGVELRG